MEGHHCRIKCLCYSADRSCTYLLSQNGKKGCSHLPGGQTQDEAGKDEPVNILNPSHIGPDDVHRAEGSCSGNGEDYITQPGKQVTHIGTIPPVVDILPGDLFFMLLDKYATFCVTQMEV